MDSWLKTTLVAVIAFAAIVTGCGSDGGSTASSESAEGGSSSVSKAAFIKQASAACLRERKNSFQRALAYEERHRSEGLPKAVLYKNSTRSVLLSIFEAEIDELRRLEAPPSDQKEIEAILTAQQKALEEAKEKRMKLSVDIEDYFVKSDQMLRKYGLTGCIKREPTNG